MLLVSKPPRRCALCAKKFALRGPIVGESAKKFALRAENTLISAFLGLLGELFRARVVGIPMLGEFFAPTGTTPRSCRRRAPSMPAAVGVLHYTKPLPSVSPACRTLM